MKMTNQQAFDFFMKALPEEIKDLGWRIGEKLDSFFMDDFMVEIIQPFILGIVEGSYHKFDDPIIIKLNIEGRE